LKCVNGCLVEKVNYDATVVAANTIEMGEIVIGGVVFPPAMVVLFVVIGIYLIYKGIKMAIKARRIMKKLAKWRQLVVGTKNKKEKGKAYANGCFVTSGAQQHGCPDEFNLK